MAKSVSLTEKGKQMLVDWAINYYDEQNEEPEAVDIVDVNIPVEQQQMEVVLKKLKRTIEILDEKLGLTERLKTDRKEKDSIFNAMTAAVAAGSFITEIVAGIIALATSNPLWLVPSTAAVLVMILSYSAIALAKTTPMTRKKLKAKLDKKLIAKDKSARKVGYTADLKFGENEYTLLLLEKLYSELLVQHQSIKNVLKAGV